MSATSDSSEEATRAAVVVAALLLWLWRCWELLWWRWDHGVGCSNSNAVDDLALAAAARTAVRSTGTLRLWLRLLSPRERWKLPMLKEGIVLYHTERLTQELCGKATNQTTTLCLDVCMGDT